MGQHGQFLVNTHASAPGSDSGTRDTATGTLTSPSFTISRHFINFLIGGGNHPGQTCLNLMVGGQVVRSATGADSNQLTPGYWDVRDLEGQKNRSIRNILPGLLPQKMIPVILELTGIDPEKKGNSMTKDERKKLRVFLKQFPLTIKGLLGFDKAIITTGGVNLKEVDPRTMRSRIINNLYFAGEILDLDGPTGGYNLQVCWSTGYLAGENAAGNLSNDC